MNLSRVKAARGECSMKRQDQSARVPHRAGFDAPAHPASAGARSRLALGAMSGRAPGSEATRCDLRMRRFVDSDSQDGPATPGPAPCRSDLAIREGVRAFWARTVLGSPSRE